MTHQGFHSPRLAVEQNNPREVAFARQWDKENGYNLSRQNSLLEQLIPECTERDGQVAATVIQWLGSNVGMSFLDEVIKASPEVKRWLSHRLGP